MQQAIDPADIYEYAVTGNALDGSVKDLAFRDRFHQFLPLQLLLIFQNCAAADHHIPALSIELENADIDISILPVFQLMYRPKINL